MATVKVSYLGGDRLQAQVRGHQLLLDQPLDAGGEDTGASPVELFVVSLAACAAYFAESYLRHHGMAADGIEVSAAYSMTHVAPARVDRITLAVVIPEGITDERRPALLRAIDLCTVHNSIREAPAISIELQTSAPAASPV